VGGADDPRLYPQGYLTASPAALANLAAGDRWSAGWAEMSCSIPRSAPPSSASGKTRPRLHAAPDPARAPGCARPASSRERPGPSSSGCDRWLIGASELVEDLTRRQAEAKTAIANGETVAVARLTEALTSGIERAALSTAPKADSLEAAARCDYRSAAERPGDAFAPSR
jgi:hypothetical protein